MDIIITVFKALLLKCFNESIELLFCDLAYAFTC
jgi:hypothetical protein